MALAASDARIQIKQEPEEFQEAWAPGLSIKQFHIVNSGKRVILVAGPRRTGKSIAVGHKVCRHLWDVGDADGGTGAKVGVFVTSYKVGTHGGSWSDLTDICLPEWLRSGMQSDDGRGTFEYLTVTPLGIPGPQLDGKTRTPFFSIRNRHGTESTCHLYSIDNENEIEQKAKQLRLSMVWIVELSTFNSEDIFKMTLQCLRWGRWEDQQWISDTNPSEDGTASWIYKTFWERRNKPTQELDEGTRKVVANMEVVEVFLEDNSFLREEEIAELKWQYQDDPDGYARHVEGRWIRANSNRGWVFSDVLDENIHIIRDCIDVDKNSSTLYTGWDPGIFNSAACIFEKRIIGGHSFWFALDEVVSVDRDVSVADFAVRFFDKMLAIEKHYKSAWPGFKGFQWNHWSDPNVLNMATHGSIALEITKVTGGQIELNPAIKGAGSVESGCNYIRRLLREERLFIGDNCPQLLDSLRRIKKGGTRGDFIDRNDKLKHIVDAMRYCLVMESLEEMEEDTRPKSSNRLIHVAS